eukprot:CAMPEP_0195028364 /NCGR_PEP_ID=MMETSP0326_2-20130528/54294_1 /TAXON_ID=2866 ORGANISM="Crypthecodinium cohnii, Strain Seligo" /NCGR_SAMPLE_ID=MMETSP0326_2 /ASSEMBLY_ACC=CAM_ASM_000348 /LENGTH=106 /DNA_ID=CAMNT_0040050861 /DNA_START=225 /DNA_END=543 /DNA_ORIENTATION=-
MIGGEGGGTEQQLRSTQNLGKVRLGVLADRSDKPLLPLPCLLADFVHKLEDWFRGLVEMSRSSAAAATDTPTPSDDGVERLSPSFFKPSSVSLDDWNIASDAAAAA